MRRCLIAMLALFMVSVAQTGQGATGKVLSINTAFGTGFDAYAAGPDDAKQAVLLLHDRFGMSGQTREWADRFAEQGYRVLAIDLYDGRHAKNWKQATQLATEIDHVWAEAGIAAAVAYLKPEQRKVVIMGWDYGATQALIATLHNPQQVAATIVYYPTELETDANKLQRIAHPVLVVVAERDEQLSTSQILAFKDGMSKTQVDFNVMGVDAGRGFVNPMSRQYDANATQTVWDVTQDFLKQYISGEQAAASGEAAP